MLFTCHMIEVVGLKLHGYGLMIGLGILAASWTSSWLAVKRGYDKKLVDHGLWWVIIPAMIGARLYHVIDYWWYYQENWMEIVQIWNGGLGIWGGIIGGAIGVVMLNSCLPAGMVIQHLHWNKQEGRFRVKPGMTWRDLFDIAAMGVPLGQAIGRVGNAINGEITGARGEPLWAIESGFDLALFGLLVILAKKGSVPGRIAGGYLMGYGLIRIALEWLRPGEQSWDIYGLPVAVIMGITSVVVGWLVGWHKKNLR